jgi:hypothetical protein
MNLTPAQAAALKVAVDAVMEGVKAAGPHGAPGGVIYAAMMAHGASFNQYTGLMGAMVRAGKLTKTGELYFLA